MDGIEDLQIIYDQDYYEYEDKDWDDWLLFDDSTPDHRKSSDDKFRRLTTFRRFTTYRGIDLRKKSIFRSYEEIKSESTVITDSSGESESIESKSSESFFIASESDEISLSDSILSLSNLSITYPVPEDVDIKGAFWILYPNPPVYKSDGVDKFFDYVDILKLAPISSLKEQLKSDRVILKFYGIDSDVIEPLSKALLFNNTVKTLDLQDNVLKPSACCHLNKLLLRNTVLSSLNLAGCKIGLDGAMKLEDGIAISSALRELNLSRCSLRNEGFYYIAKSVASNTLIKKLDISDNHLDEESAPHVQTILVYTESLEYLNLSWNDFYTREAIERVFGGLTKNTSLVELNMTWNAMGKNGVFFIKNFIQNSRNIKYLDLSANRFSDSEAQQIANALLKNRSLLEFRFGKNPLRSKAVGAFIRTLGADSFINSPLILLDFESYWSTKDALPTIEQLKISKPNLTIKLAGILENFNIVGPDLKELFFKTANYEAMKSKIKKERKNFGHFVLSLEDKKISRDKFQELVEVAKIQISENLVKEITKQFLVTKKSLDQGALKESYLSYFPDTVLPKPKTSAVVADKQDKSKKKKGKKGKKAGKKSAKKKKGKK